MYIFAKHAISRTSNPKNPSEAIEQAVDECIEEGILADILITQKAEVLELALTTFDRELYEQGLREEDLQ